jgi:hypothetical protein
MKMMTESLKTLRVALAIAVAGTVAGLAIAPAFAATTTTTTIPATTTSTATSTTTTTTTDSGGLIKSGASRSECLTPNFSDSGLSALQGAITKFDTLTGTSVSCISAYLNGAPSWTNWVHPWITQAQYGYSSWVAQAPQVRQLVLQVDLIPTSLKNIKNPIKWERSCAQGNFDAHATQLGTSLVAAGLGHSVIRLGAEMNGNWEVDFVGNTPSEHRLWLQCFDNEVTGLRQATGQHFLIDWNPNPCQYNLPYLTLYPGNSYVNIVGLDLFDVSCAAPTTPYTFARLANEPAGLSTIAAFAKVHHKPLSLPEWGLSVQPSGDDPNFIDGIGSEFDSRDFAFETYFDVPGSKGTSLPLGSRTPLSLGAFHRWFAGALRH